MQMIIIEQNIGCIAARKLDCAQNITKTPDCLSNVIYYLIVDIISNVSWYLTLRF